MEAILRKKTDRPKKRRKEIGQIRIRIMLNSTIYNKKD
jgi:hypothetical protein